MYPPGCLSEAGIALDDGLRGNESQEEVGNRVHVEEPWVIRVVFGTDRILRNYFDQISSDLEEYWFWPLAQSYCPPTSVCLGTNQGPENKVFSSTFQICLTHLPSYIHIQTTIQKHPSEKNRRKDLNKSRHKADPVRHGASFPPNILVVVQLKHSGMMEVLLMVMIIWQW